MKKVTPYVIASALSMIAGVWACVGPLPLPIPPVPINVSTMDMGLATFQGYGQNAGYAAALKKLDQLGKEAVGAEAWHSNNYVGTLTYSVKLAGVVGVNSFPIDKPCNQDAIDNAEKTSGGGGGGGGSIGGCAGEGSSTGIVGFTPTTRQWSVCSSVSCSTGTYIEYTPVYGQIDASGC